MEKPAKKPKTVSIFTGFFFILNVCIGTGFLGIPYAFFYSGYVSAILTLSIITFLSWANTNYVLEVTARAQALEYLKKSASHNGTITTSSDVQDSDDIDDGYQKNGRIHHTTSLLPDTTSHPKFEITVHRKFEITELCEIFVGRYLKYAYLALFIMSSLLTLWSYSAVAASAWATNIPFQNFGSVEKCREEAFLHNVLPSGGCLYAYYFCLTLFGLIVVTLSMLDLKELGVIQVALGVVRLVTIAAIVLYCIVGISQKGNFCLDELGNNATAGINNTGLTATVFNFDPRGWVMSIPIFAYAVQFQAGLSTLVHPIKEKEHLHWMVNVVYLVSSLSYISVGVVVPLWFQASIQETCTLNWAIYTSSNHSVPLRAFSYYLIIFPSIDVVSAYPLANHVIVNNLYILIMRQDTSRKPKYKFDRLLRLFLRLSSSLLPVLAAFGVANLVYILKYAGFLLFLSYTIPLILHLRSIHVCKRKFAFSKSGSSSMERLDSEKENSKFRNLSLYKMMNLLCCKDKQAIYMTRYSNILISHPVSGWMIGAAVTCLLGLAFSSFFVQPDKLTCELVVDQKRT